MQLSLVSPLLNLGHVARVYHVRVCKTKTMVYTASTTILLHTQPFHGALHLRRKLNIWISLLHLFYFMCIGGTSLWRRKSLNQHLLEHPLCTKWHRGSFMQIYRDDCAHTESVPCQKTTPAQLGFPLLPLLFNTLYALLQWHNISTPTNHSCLLCMLFCVMCPGCNKDCSEGMSMMYLYIKPWFILN